jgi:hypothetical protein
MEILSDFISKPLFEYSHWKTDQHAAADANQSSNTRKVFIQKIQIALHGQSANMESSMNDRAMEDCPSTVHMKLM